MADKITQDRKKDDTLDTDLNMPELDGLSLDNPLAGGGMVDGSGRKPSSPTKTITIEGLKGVGAGVGSGIAEQLYRAMPNLRPVVDEVTQGYREFKDLKTELAGQISPMMIGLEDSARKLLPRAKKFVPKALYDKVHKKLDDRHKQRQAEAYPQLTKQQLESDQISAELGQIFGTSPETAQQMAIDQKKTELTNIALDSARHKTTTVQLSHVYESLRATELFHRTVHTSYMRKSLELKYKHLFVARDTFNLLAKSMATFEGYYKGLLRNTALPDMMKIQIGDYHRRNVTQKYGQLMADFKGNIRKHLFNKIKDKVKGAVQGLGIFADQVGMAAMASDMQQQMNDTMGGGNQNAEVGFLANLVGRALGAVGAGSVAKHYLGKVRPLTDNIDNTVKNFKTNAFLKAAHLRRRWSGGNKLERFLADLLPEMSRLEKGGNDLLTKPNDAAVFDTMTRQSIVEIIPGYLGKILHSLEQRRTGDDNIPQTVYDVYTRKFDTVDNLKAHMAERMYGSEGSRRDLYINAISALHTGLDRNASGLSAERQKEESDFLDEIGPDINRFMVNHAVHSEFLDIDKLREFVNTNGESAKYSTYLKYVLSGIKHDPIKVVQSFLRGVLKEDGSIDKRVYDSVTNSITEYRNFDSYKVELARAGETYGYRSYLSDKVGTAEKEALLKQIQEGGEKGAEAAEKLKGKLGLFADNNYLNMREIARMLASVDYGAEDNEVRIRNARERTTTDYANLDEGERQAREFAEKSGIAGAYRTAKEFASNLSGKAREKGAAAYDWLGGVATDVSKWTTESIDKVAQMVQSKEARDKFYNNLRGTFDSVKTYGGQAIDTVKRVLDDPEEAYKAAKDVVYRKSAEYRRQFEESETGQRVKDVIDSVQTKVNEAIETGKEFYEEKTPDSVKKFLDDTAELAKKSPDYARELVQRLQTAYGEHVPAEVRDKINDVVRTAKDTISEKSAEAARIVTQLMNDPEYRKQAASTVRGTVGDVIEEINEAVPKSREEVTERLRTARQRMPLPSTEDLKSSADELKSVFAKAMTDAINSIKDVTGAGTGAPPTSAPPEVVTEGFRSNTDLLTQLLNLYRDNSAAQRQDLADWRDKLSEDHEAIFSAVNWINRTLREMPPAIAAGTPMGGGPSEGPAPQYGMWGRGGATIRRMFRSGIRGAGIALNKVGKVYTHIYGKALEGAGTAINGIGNMMGRGFDALGRYAGAFGQNLPGIIDRVGGGLKNLGKGYVSIYNTTLNGIFGTARTIAGGLFGTRDVPYVDIYRKDEVGGDYRPILTAAMQERDPGVFFGNGKRVRNSEDITEPVFDVAGKPLIAQTDIEHGLVGADNKPISTKKGAEGLISKAFGILKGIAPGIGKGIGSIADLYKNIYTKLFGFAVDGAKGIGKLAGKFINRLFGFDVGGASKEMNANMKLMVDFMKTTNENVALIQKDVDLIARRKKKGTAAGDLDGDGDIDGTYQDQMERRAAEEAGRNGEAGSDGRDGRDGSTPKRNRTWREIARDMFGRAPGDPEEEEGSSFFGDMMKWKAFEWLTKKLGRGRGAWRWARKARAGAFLGKKALDRGATAAWEATKGLATPAGRAAASGAVRGGLSTAGRWIGAHGGRTVLTGAGHLATKLPWLGSLFGAGTAAAGTGAAAAGAGAAGAAGAGGTLAAAGAANAWNPIGWALLAAAAAYAGYRGIKGFGKQATMENLGIGDERDVMGEDRIYSALGLNTKLGAKGIRGLSKLSGIDALVKMFHGDENPMTEDEVKEGHAKLSRKVEKGLPGYDKILQEYEKAVAAHNWPRARQLSGKEADGFWKRWGKDTIPGMIATGTANLFFGNKDEALTKEQIEKVHNKFKSIIKKGGAAAKHAERLMDKFDDYVADGNWKKAREIANMENRGLFGKLFQDSKGNIQWGSAIGALTGPVGYLVGSLFNKTDEDKPMTEEEVKSVRMRLDKLAQADNKPAKKLLEQFDEAVTEMNWKKARKLCGKEVMSNLAKFGRGTLSAVKWGGRLATLGISMLFETSNENPMTEKEIMSFTKKMNYLVNKGDKNAAKKLEKFETAVAKEDWERARAIAKMPHHSAIYRAGKATAKWFFGNDDDEMTDAEIDKFRESMNRKIKMGNKSAERKLEAFDEAVGRGNWRKARILAQNPDEGIIQATGHALATVGRFFFGGDDMAMSDSEIERTRKKLQNAVNDGRKNAQKRLDMFEDYVADGKWKKARALAGLPYENILKRTGKGLASWLFGGNNDKEMTSDEIDDFRSECEARIADGNKKAEKLLNQFNAAVAAEDWDKARKLSKTKDTGVIGEVRKGFKSAWNWLLGNKDRKDCEEMREKIEDKALDDPTGVINAGLEQFNNYVKHRQFNKAIKLGEDILKYTPKELASKRHFSTEEFDRLSEKAQKLEENIRKAEKKNNGWVHPIKEMKLAMLRRQLMNNSDQWSDDYFDDIADELGEITGEADFYSERSKPNEETLNTGRELVERIEQQYNKRSWWKNPIVKSQLSSLKNEVKNSVMDWDDAMFDAWEERLEEIDDDYKSSRLASYEDQDEFKERKRLKKRANALDSVIDRTLDRYSWIGSPFVKQQLWGLRNTVKSEAALWSDKQFNRWYKELHEIDVDGEASKVLAENGDLRSADRETRMRVENQRILKKYMKDNDWLADKYTWIGSPRIKTELKADKAQAKFMISDMNPAQAKAGFMALYANMKRLDEDHELDEAHSTMYNLDEDEANQDRAKEISERNSAVEELLTLRKNIAKYRSEASKKPDSGKLLASVAKVESKMNKWLLGVIGDDAAINLWANDPVTYPKPLASDFVKHVYTWIKEIHNLDSTFYKNETLDGVDIDEYQDTVTKEDDEKDRKDIEEMRARNRVANDFIAFVRSFKTSYLKAAEIDDDGELESQIRRLGSKIYDYVRTNLGINSKARNAVAKSLYMRDSHIDKKVLVEWTSGNTGESAEKFANAITAWKKMLRDLDKNAVIVETTAVADTSAASTSEPAPTDEPKAEPEAKRPVEEPKTPEETFAESVPQPKIIDKDYIAKLTGADPSQLTGSEGEPQNNAGKNLVEAQKAVEKQPAKKEPVLVKPEPVVRSNMPLTPMAKAVEPVVQKADAAPTTGKTLPTPTPVPESKIQPVAVKKSVNSLILEEAETKAKEMAKAHKDAGAATPNEKGDNSLSKFDRWMSEFLRSKKVKASDINGMKMLGQMYYRKAFEQVGKTEPVKPIEAAVEKQPANTAPTNGKALPEPVKVSKIGDERVAQSVRDHHSALNFYRGTDHVEEDEGLTEDGGYRKTSTVHGRKIANQWLGDKLTPDQYNLIKALHGRSMGRMFDDDPEIMEKYALAEKGEFREYTEEEKAAKAKQEAEKAAAKQRAEAYKAKMEKLKATDPKKYEELQKQRARMGTDDDTFDFASGGYSKQFAAGGTTTTDGAVNTAMTIIKKYEGFHAKPYICPAGKKTIGYGFTDSDSLAKKEMTEETASTILKSKVVDILKSIDGEVSGLSDDQRAALCSFVFNLGLSNFKSSTLLKRLKAKKWDDAVKEIKKWDKATVDGEKKTLKGLTKRRAEEATYLAKTKTETKAVAKAKPAAKKAAPKPAVTVAKLTKGKGKRAKMAGGGYAGTDRYPFGFNGKVSRMANGGFSKKFGIGGMFKSVGNFASNLVSSDGMGTNRELVQILADHIDKNYDKYLKWQEATDYPGNPFRFFGSDAEKVQQYCCPIDPKNLPEDFEDSDLNADTIEALSEEINRRHHGTKLTYLDRMEERARFRDLDRYAKSGGETMSSLRPASVSDVPSAIMDTVTHGLFGVAHGFSRRKAEEDIASREKYANGGFSEDSKFLTKPTTSTDADGNTILAGEAKTEAIIPLTKRPGNLLMRLGGKIKDFLSGKKPEGPTSIDTTSNTNQASVHASDPASEPMTNYLAKQLSDVIGPIGSQSLYSDDPEKPGFMSTTYGNIKNEISDKVNSTAGKIGGRALKFVAGKTVGGSPLAAYLLDKGSGELLSGTPIGLSDNTDTSDADFFTRFSSSQNALSQAGHGDKLAGTVNGVKDAFLLGTPIGRATHAIAKTTNFGTGVAKDILEQRKNFITEEFRKNNPTIASYGDSALDAAYVGSDWVNKFSGLFKDGGFSEAASKTPAESFDKPKSKSAETEWSSQVTNAKIATANKAESGVSSQQVVNGLSDQTAKTEEVLAELKKLVSLFSEAFKGGMIKVAGMNDLAAIMANQTPTIIEQPSQHGLPNPSNGPSYDESRGLDLRKLSV